MSKVAAAKVSAAETQQLLDEGWNYLDVRSPEEYAAARVPGAVNIPIWVKGGEGFEPNRKFLEEVELRFPKKETAVVVGCQSGKRSELATKVMEEAGYGKLMDMSCGFGGWVQAGLPTQQ